MWDYRVIRRDGNYYIHECFLDKQNKPSGITKEPATVFSEDVGNIEWVLKRMLAALELPYLDYEKFIGKD